jgi:hypothetical protein
MRAYQVTGQRGRGAHALESDRAGAGRCACDLGRGADPHARRLALAQSRPCLVVSRGRPRHCGNIRHRPRLHDGSLRRHLGLSDEGAPTAPGEPKLARGSAHAEIDAGDAPVKLVAQLCALCPQAVARLNERLCGWGATRNGKGLAAAAARARQRMGAERNLTAASVAGKDRLAMLLPHLLGYLRAVRRGRPRGRPLSMRRSNLDHRHDGAKATRRPRDGDATGRTIGTRFSLPPIALSKEVSRLCGHRRMWQGGPPSPRSAARLGEDDLRGRRAGAEGVPVQAGFDHSSGDRPAERTQPAINVRAGSGGRYG